MNKEQTLRCTRITALLLFIGAFLTMALLHHPVGGWNANTRLALVFSVVDFQTLSIDAYHDVPPYDTGDKAYFEDRFYSDKIFGVSLAALPAYAIAKAVLGDMSYQLAQYICRVFAVSLPGAFSLALMFMLLCRLGSPPKLTAVFITLIFLGTPLFGYSTVFYPYMPGIACVLGALYLTLFPRAERLTPLNCTLIGFCLGYALLCDLIFGLIIFGVGMTWLIRLLDQLGVYGVRAFAEMKGERIRLKQALVLSALFWVGVLIPLSLFFLYSWHIFGTLTIPYKYEYDKTFLEGMSQGFMGVTSPKLPVLYYITFHPYRGLFFWSPVLLISLIGLIIGTRAYGKRRIIAWLGIWGMISYLLFNAGYYMWWGGFGMGPRFLLPMIPFLALGIGEVLRQDKLSILYKKTSLRKTLLTMAGLLGLISFFLCFPLSVFDPQVPQRNPTEVLTEVKWGAEINIPQYQYLSEYYMGYTNPWIGARLDGRYFAETPSLWNAFFGFLLLLPLIPGLVYAYRILPESSPWSLRNDYPFKTMDGTAAPPPPGLK